MQDTQIMFNIVFVDHINDDWIYFEFKQLWKSFIDSKDKTNVKISITDLKQKLESVKLPHLNAFLGHFIASLKSQDLDQDDMMDPVEAQRGVREVLGEVLAGVSNVILKIEEETSMLLGQVRDAAIPNFEGHGQDFKDDL